MAMIIRYILPDITKLSGTRNSKKLARSDLGIAHGPDADDWRDELIPEDFDDPVRVICDDAVKFEGFHSFKIGYFI